MPSPINTPVPTTATGVTVTTTAETVAVISSPVNTDQNESVVVLDGLVDITVGTGGATVTLKLERGNVAGGTLVQAVGPLTVTAANRYQASILGIDRPGVVTGQLYVLTVTVASATGNSTVNFAALQAQSQATA